jgi:ABC-type glutathione transport system ATPase component
MAPLLQISGLSVDYAAAAGETVRALRGVDLEVSAGETVGILGESGSGKSSLALSLLRLLPANASVTSGSITWRGRDLLRMQERDLRQVRGGEVSLIFQEPALALNPVLTAGRQIADVLRAHRPVDEAECRRETSSVLAMAGFRDPERVAQAYPHQLSGGERQRVALAQAIVCRPSLLVADEPLSSLDLMTQAEILALLRRLQQELGLAILMITHNPGVLEALGARAMVMRGGEMVARGSVPQLRQSADPYLQRLLHPAGELASAGPATGSDSGDPLLSVRNLRKTFFQKRAFFRGKFSVQALEEVDFKLERGTATVIVGRSGSGKSTLARCIAGFETPDAGEMLLDGAPLGRISTGHPRPVQMVFQDSFTSLNPVLTAEQIISEPMEIAHQGNRAVRRERSLALMEEAGLDRAWAGRRAVQFSGGQRQRLAIARALAVQPKLLVLDEAFSGLDLALQAQMLRLLISLQAAHGLTCLSISHDLNFVSLFAQRVLVMEQGRLVETLNSGSLDAAAHPATQSLLAAGRSLAAPGMGGPL